MSVKTTEPIVNINDVRAAGFCASGARRWFETWGFDFRKFLREGIPASTLLQTEDAFALRVVKRKAESNGDL